VMPTDEQLQEVADQSGVSVELVRERVRSMIENHNRVVETWGGKDEDNLIKDPTEKRDAG